METDNNSINYDAVLADLESKKAVLESAIAGIRAILGQSGQSGAAASQSVNGSTGSVNVSSDAFFQMTIPDAAIKYLKMARKPQGTKAIADALEQGGMTHTSKDFYQTVGSSLNRRADAPNSELVSVRRGEWGIAEWYPGLKKPRKTGADAEPAKDDVKPIQAPK